MTERQILILVVFWSMSVGLLAFAISSVVAGQIRVWNRTVRRVESPKVFCLAVCYFVAASLFNFLLPLWVLTAQR